ncbi:hypothetical protein ACFWOK_20620 [Streptomyces sindenensis]|uniref:Secreted protein n=1 Tax=Streptomyces sindenensis TaxID=67363 RepID=A0ABW6ER69_9ACTN
MAHSTLSRLLPASTAAVAALIGFSAAPALAAIWTSSEQWGNCTTSDDYILYNNIWGSGAGTESIWADSSSNWGVTANHPNTGGTVDILPILKWIKDTKGWWGGPPAASAVCPALSALRPEPVPCSLAP